jgi:hypothetical protein
VRRLEVARATHTQAVSQVGAARAEVERAKEQQGGSEENNAKLRSALRRLKRRSSICPTPRSGRVPAGWSPTCKRKSAVLPAPAARS